MLKGSLTQIMCYYVNRQNNFSAILEIITSEEAIIPARFIADIWWRYLMVKLQALLGVMLWR
jgi:hypothetical protein